MASQQGELPRWEVTEPYMNLHCALGEGPHYEPATNTLRFVDIMKHRLHTVDLASKEPSSSVSTVQLDTPISVTADIEGVDPKEKLLVGLKYGMAVLDRAKGTYEYLCRFAAPKEDNEDLRGNDGAVDPDGRFWLGSMTDFGRGPFQPHGSLHLFTGKQPTTTTLKTSLSIPNSVGWSPDGKTMYFTHTAEGVVYGYDYSSSSAAATATATNERIVYRHEGPGSPDGFRVDVEGYIWHAFYGGSNVLKIDPKLGQVVGEIKLPTPNITCVEFVGKELYITTASVEGEEGGLGGAVFKVDVGVEGLAHDSFKM